MLIGAKKRFYFDLRNMETCLSFTMQGNMEIDPSIKNLKCDYIDIIDRAKEYARPDCYNEQLYRNLKDNIIKFLDGLKFNGNKCVYYNKELLEKILWGLDLYLLIEFDLDEATTDSWDRDFVSLWNSTHHK